ncbi:hypothetical protein [Streptomyces zagrosensis]|uniref:Uncharacterized protein n=1 Tax=Streptomyces zagrosensis TaxID=1042984 RepID=A0A7W9V0Q2_9ACTN|nr:hypothetical protein [Streptomyces zagrosensis]MBB5938448.1 hypothetical protein [Streptomyces zagrosensis]
MRMRTRLRTRTDSDRRGGGEAALEGLGGLVGEEVTALVGEEVTALVGEEVTASVGEEATAPRGADARADPRWDWGARVGSFPWGQGGAVRVGRDSADTGSVRVSGPGGT